MNHVSGFDLSLLINDKCRIRGLPEPVGFERLESITIKGRERRPIHFHRFRNKRGLIQPDTQGSFWHLAFDKPVQGPLALGFGCHYGLGMFKPAELYEYYHVALLRHSDLSSGYLDQL